jgi:hypothetical protein
VTEVSSGQHAHMIFTGTDRIADRLQRSKKYTGLHVEPVPDADRLTHRYLSKERTSSANFYGHRQLGGRISGPHRLAGCGDRVRLSVNLESACIDAGVIRPWLHHPALPPPRPAIH